MGNNSSKPVNENKNNLKKGASIKKKRKSSNTIPTTKTVNSSQSTINSNNDTSKINSVSNPISQTNSVNTINNNINSSEVSGNNIISSSKPLLKKKLKQPLKSSNIYKQSDLDDEADQEDEAVEDDDTDINEENSTLRSNVSSPAVKSHKRSSSQGSILTSSRRRKSYNGDSQLTKTSSISSSNAQQQGVDSGRPHLKHSSKSTDSVYSNHQQPRISSRKSSMSEVPASMVMSLEPRGSILKRTSSNISSSASQSRHASDNALTDGYDDDGDDDDDDDDDEDEDGRHNKYQGYNRSEVYEDIYKSGNISRGILRNSSSNTNIKNAQAKKNLKHRSSSSSIPGGLTRSSTRGSTSNSEFNHGQSRTGSTSESGNAYNSFDKVNDMMDKMNIEKTGNNNNEGQEVAMSDFLPPLIHRHSSFGTNTESGQDHYPVDLKYPSGHSSNNEDAINDDGEDQLTSTNNSSGQQEYTTYNDSHLEYDNNSNNNMDEDQSKQNIPTETNFIAGNSKYKKPLDLDATIQKLLDAGYSGKRTKNVILKNSEIQQICTIAREIFLQQPSLLELSPPVKIVGDVHGQFHDLIRMFEKCGFPPTSNYLFLGDYVDRGKQSLETILLLLCYKIKYPENFFLLRGNHECASVTRVYGFYDECKRRCNVRTWKYFIDTFNTMPLASIVAGKIFCVHGGLSPVLNSMDEIRLVSRPTDVPDFGLINDLLWSDPTDSVNEWEDNERGVSYCYNKVAINKFLNRFGFDLVCRAHMVVEDGYEFFNDHTLVTVFSAPNYCGEFDNWGAVMSVNHELLCSFELLEPLDSIALKQVMKRGKIERKLAIEENSEELPQVATQNANIEQ